LRLPGLNFNFPGHNTWLPIAWFFLQRTLASFPFRTTRVQLTKVENESKKKKKIKKKEKKKGKSLGNQKAKTMGGAD